MVEPVLRLSPRKSSPKSRRQVKSVNRIESSRVEPSQVEFNQVDELGRGGRRYPVELESLVECSQVEELGRGARRYPVELESLLEGRLGLRGAE